MHKKKKLLAMKEKYVKHVKKNEAMQTNNEDVRMSHIYI